MPKLPKKKAQSVEQQEVQDFTPVPGGRYVLALRGCVNSDEPGPSGSHYWTWEFEIEEPETRKKDGKEMKTKGRRLWVTTSLAETAEWKLKEVFDAFGYSSDSDTDEMIGEKVVAYVSEGVVEKGPKKGQPTNVVDRLAPYEEDGEGVADEGDQF